MKNRSQRIKKKYWVGVVRFSKQKKKPRRNFFPAFKLRDVWFLSDIFSHWLLRNLCYDSRHETAKFGAFIFVQRWCRNNQRQKIIRTRFQSSYYSLMAEITGFEPVTYALRTHRSTIWAISPQNAFIVRQQISGVRFCCRSKSVSARKRAVLKIKHPEKRGAVVRDVRLELTRSPTRPLNVRVCRFRQSRIAT